MSVQVCWDSEAEQPPARLAAWRSMNAVVRGAKDEWVALFAPDGVVEDPVGPSMFDPDGAGHHGHEAISAFWESKVARFAFTIRLVRGGQRGRELRHDHHVPARRVPGGHRRRVRLPR